MKGALAAHGFSWRKRALLRRFTGRDDIRFITRGRDAQGATLLLWGSAPVPDDVPEGTPVVRVEDGFVRSVGLGADLVRPCSWVLDGCGIYYDATRPSELERLLQAMRFTPTQLARAARLRERIVAAGLTKYNLAPEPWRRPAAARHVVLVAGQVETDASLAFGGASVAGNLALLRAARAQRPDSWLVYKPHPDVVAGLRRPGADEQQAAAQCDEVLAGGSMHQLAQQVDEVHVMTSLAGFEALLRGCRVVCHGWPFYAGWGLTHDLQPHPRRTRRLTLDALVAGALLEYPVYVSPRTGERCEPEQAIDELADWQRRQPAGAPPWRRWLRPLLARP